MLQRETGPGGRAEAALPDPAPVVACPHCCITSPHATPRVAATPGRPALQQRGLHAAPAVFLGALRGGHPKPKTLNPLVQRPTEAALITQYTGAATTNQQTAAYKTATFQQVPPPLPPFLTTPFLLQSPCVRL